MLKTLLLFSLLSLYLSAASLDRQAIVSRHNVVVTTLDPEAAVSVGNGDFAFTVDATGLQSFGELYYEKGLPLETLAGWAWHTYPNPEDLRMEDTLQKIRFHGREIPYATNQQSPAGKYFRENPHPIPLGELGFLYKGKPLLPDQLSDIHQTLDLWSGLIHSRFKLDGEPVSVETVAAPEGSRIGVKVHSRLLEQGVLSLRLRFAYSHALEQGNKPPLVWDKENHHQSEFCPLGHGEAEIHRTLDSSKYVVGLRWLGDGAWRQTSPHVFLMTANKADLSLVFSFSSEKDHFCGQFENVRNKAGNAWREFWVQGGLADFSKSQDPRAHELERRIILSLYLTKVNYAGSMPPSETGLTHLSWFGKHNSEVYFWHAAHFYQWGRTELLEKGLSWYLSILPKAKAVADAEGYEGAHWPKMSGPDGRPSPGSINPFIIWNQPTPIYLCELVRRAKPGKDTLERYAPLVFSSADFLASYAVLDPETGFHVLGPPLKNVSEKSKPEDTRNPCFELAYWRYGLMVAQKWRAYLGLPPEPRWEAVLARLSPLPLRNGLYLELESEPGLYQKQGRLPVSMLLSYGYLPATPGLDIEAFRKTFEEVHRRNGPDSWVSWSMGQGALAAARLGNPETAVNILCNTTPSARFMPSGHVRRPKEPNRCVAYLPVNGALLCAAGLMIAGWDGSPDRACPGFPDDGTWTIDWEGLNKLP